MEKIVAENGTVVIKEGSYVEEGSVVIAGILKDRLGGITKVHAKGIVKINNDYIYAKEYAYKEKKQNYTNKRKYTVGITLNDKEFYVKYLHDTQNYDKIKKSAKFKILKNNISLDWYILDLYNLEEINYTYEQLIEKAKEDAEKYFDEYILNLNEAKINNIQYEIQNLDEGIKVISTANITERIGTFKENDESEYFNIQEEGENNE